MIVTKIFLLNGNTDEKGIDPKMTAADVIVYLANGEKYIASFISYKKINYLRKQNIVTGEFLKGKYFWVKQMVLIDSCELKNIKEVIKELIDQGDFKNVFGLLNKNSIE